MVLCNIDDSNNIDDSGNIDDSDNRMLVHACMLFGKAHDTSSSKIASSKSFRLVDTREESTSRQPAETNWDLCVL